MQSGGDTRGVGGGGGGGGGGAYKLDLTVYCNMLDSKPTTSSFSTLSLVCGSRDSRLLFRVLR